MKSEKVNAKELLQALDELQTEKGITKEYMIESLKMALEAAYKKNYETKEEVNVDIDEVTGNIKVYAVKTVVENVEDPDLEINLESAKEISKRAKVGKTINIEVTPKNFGRIAASAGKQIMTVEPKFVPSEAINVNINLISAVCPICSTAISGINTVTIENKIVITTLLLYLNSVRC